MPGLSFTQPLACLQARCVRWLFGARFVGDSFLGCFGQLRLIFPSSDSFEIEEVGSGEVLESGVFLGEVWGLGLGYSQAERQLSQYLSSRQAGIVGLRDFLLAWWALQNLDVQPTGAGYSHAYKWRWPKRYTQNGPLVKETKTKTCVTPALSFQATQMEHQGLATSRSNV